MVKVRSKSRGNSFAELERQTGPLKSEPQTEIVRNLAGRRSVVDAEVLSESGEPGTEGHAYGGNATPIVGADLVHESGTGNRSTHTLVVVVGVVIESGIGDSLRKADGCSGEASHGVHSVQVVVLHKVHPVVVVIVLLECHFDRGKVRTGVPLRSCLMTVWAIGSRMGTAALGSPSLITVRVVLGACSRALRKLSAHNSLL